MRYAVQAQMNLLFCKAAKVCKRSDRDPEEDEITLGVLSHNAAPLPSPSGPVLKAASALSLICWPPLHISLLPARSRAHRQQQQPQTCENAHSAAAGAVWRSFGIPCCSPPPMALSTSKNQKLPFGTPFPLTTFRTSCASTPPTTALTAGISAAVAT